MSNVERLFKFIHERHRIYVARANYQPKPWTADPILQQYRFCNVYRELDTVTQWIAKNWRVPFKHDPHLWFAMCVARLVNWPATLEVLEYPVPFNSTRFKRTMAGFNGKAWGGAYIVSTNGNKMIKHDYIADRVLQPLWEDRGVLTQCYQHAQYLMSFHEHLMEYIGIGSFLSAQVIADLKYVMPLRRCTDWHTFAASGPGSRRGLNRVLDRDVDAPWVEKKWLGELFKLNIQLQPYLKKAKKPELPALHLQDLQNCLCEFDKYERTRLGEGRPRSRYQGVA